MIGDDLYCSVSMSMSFSDTDNEDMMSGDDDDRMKDTSGCVYQCFMC